MPLSTYHVSATAGAFLLFFGDAMDNGWPIAYATPVASGTTVWYDPACTQGIYSLAWTHAINATGAIHTNGILPLGHTMVASGSGGINQTRDPKNFGVQNAWFYQGGTGSGLPTQEVE